MYAESFRQNGNLPALSDYLTPDDSFTYFEVAQEIAKIHIIFDKAGINQGDKIALVGRNTPRWCVAYLATITYGAVIVPILQDFNNNDIITIVNHSESRLMFLSDNFWKSMEGSDVPAIEAVFSLDSNTALYERSGDALTTTAANIEQEFAAKYSNGFSNDDITYPEIANDRECLLNYTSGTTGNSKGVILTVNNLTGNVMIASGYINPNTKRPYFDRGGRCLSFLPLAHAYGCAFDFLTWMAVGGHVTLLGRIPTPKILMEGLQRVKPTVVCSVPMILEKIYRKQIAPLLEKTSMKIALKIPGIRSLIYSKMHAKLAGAFGGCVEAFMIGGAPINPETEAFLLKIGLPITVGYGMTECAPLITFSGPTTFKAQSCGASLLGYSDVRVISKDPRNIPGEIEVRGEHVMVGYYKNEEATNAAFTADGWLITGDMGVIEPDGTLYIKGRSKTMILSANGQNIYPEQIEDRLNGMRFVSESLVIENGNSLDALVVPDLEAMRIEGVSKDSLAEIMAENMRELNKLVANYERIASITIHDEEFVKTPKKSIKRYLYTAELVNSLKNKSN